MSGLKGVRQFLADSLQLVKLPCLGTVPGWRVGASQVSALDSAGLTQLYLLLSSVIPGSELAEWPSLGIFLRCSERWACQEKELHCFLYRGHAGEINACRMTRLTSGVKSSP